jgi:hypothetical protein
MLCNAHQSPQQVLFSLYNAIALTELKGYTMIQFAYMLKRLYGEGTDRQFAGNFSYRLVVLKATSLPKRKSQGNASNSAPTGSSKR